MTTFSRPKLPCLFFLLFFFVLNWISILGYTWPRGRQEHVTHVGVSICQHFVYHHAGIAFPPHHTLRWILYVLFQQGRSTLYLKYYLSRSAMGEISTCQADFSKEEKVLCCQLTCSTIDFHFLSLLPPVSRFVSWQCVFLGRIAHEVFDFWRTWEKAYLPFYSAGNTSFLVYGDWQTNCQFCPLVEESYIP